MRNYNKYKKTFKRKKFNPYIIFLFIIVCIISMSVGYAEFREVLTIRGTANAKYKVFQITYELNGGTNPENTIYQFTIIDEDPLPVPTKSGYTFEGWYISPNFLGTAVTTTESFESDVTLYAKWKKQIVYGEEFHYDGEYVFDGTNYLDTNIYLYTEENIHRNFITSFNIVNVASTNIKDSTLVNSMDESQNTFPGHNVKINDKKALMINTNSRYNTTGDVIIPNTVTNVRILRLSDKLYYSFDNEDFILLNDYVGFRDFFEIPVTFGSSIDENGDHYRFFTGTLSDMRVAFLDDDLTIDDFNTPRVWTTVYEHQGQYAFNGTSDYINTGLQFFTEENINQDFEISFNIDSIGEGYVNQAVLVNMKLESGAYPGFVYRLYQSGKTIKLEGKGGTGSAASHSQSSVHSVKISRIDSIIYLTINDGTQIRTFDYSKFKNYFDVPLTIGAALDGSGVPFRYFVGTLSDIVIKVRE